MASALRSAAPRSWKLSRAQVGATRPSRACPRAKRALKPPAPPASGNDRPRSWHREGGALAPSPRAPFPGYIAFFSAITVTLWPCRILAVYPVGAPAKERHPRSPQPIGHEYPRRCHCARVRHSPARRGRKLVPLPRRAQEIDRGRRGHRGVVVRVAGKGEGAVGERKILPPAVAGARWPLSMAAVTRMATRARPGAASKRRYPQVTATHCRG